MKLQHEQKLFSWLTLTDCLKLKCVCVCRSLPPGPLISAERLQRLKTLLLHWHVYMSPVISWQRCTNTWRLFYWNYLSLLNDRDCSYLPFSKHFSSSVTSKALITCPDSPFSHIARLLTFQVRIADYSGREAPTWCYFFRVMYWICFCGHVATTAFTLFLFI